ncbi:hypothetical protein SPBR_06318 [Sporothrix brasiliensis 5110]|uniref:Glucan 4-alpha-glucosidase n=1 Tax=Sporothrix brasiliensis 5110 TaxID=1398154 RepID=A0A0C2EQ56_9PEZI|nr:uncharacterized protein SPBR_06318 [Sporothrix brasiliensis 5110]KIH88464.1 hypothetical protein SPBR_06318 [Sporothrix brasiliensis 5110]
MPSASQVASDDDDASSSSSPSSNPSTSTYRAATPQKQKQKPGNDAPTTPKHRNASAGQTPRSAPAAAAAGLGAVAAGTNRPRRLSQSQKVQPTLLTDFFLGRPSQARVQAQRKKMNDVAAVKAEMRTAMRQSSVMRLQQPGGVRDRVKNWQKANASAMAGGNPEAEPSEPTDVAAGTDEQSVTEEDRIRIRARQKLRAPKQPTIKKEYPKTDGEDNGPGSGLRKQGKAGLNDRSGKSEGDNESDPGYDIFEDPGPKFHTVKTPKGRKGLNGVINAGEGSPPKKRIVSDEHWMKRRTRTSPKTRPKTKAGAAAGIGSSMPIPKDFLQRTAQNPTVKNKIKDWANRVEPHSPPKSPRHDYRKESPVGEGDESDVTKGPGPTSWRSAPDDGIRVRPIRSTRSAEDSRAQEQQRAVKDNTTRWKKTQNDDGIRIRPMLPNESTEDIIEVILSEEEQVTPRKKKFMPNDGIRVHPGRATTPNGDAKENITKRRVSATKKNAPVPASSQERARTGSLGTSTTHSAPTESTQFEESSLISVESITEEPESVLRTPTKKPVPRPRPRPKVKEPLQRRRRPSLTETRGDETTTRNGSFHEGSVGSWSDNDDDSNSIADSYGPSTVPPKSLADIPVGYSAFSELDLPIRGGGGRGRPRTVRKESFKGVPSVLKKVVSEGKKILHDKVDPPKPVVNQPPSIENWLHGTVDPFVEPTPARKVSSAQARQSTETQWKKDVQRRSTSETRKRDIGRSPTHSPNETRRVSSQKDSEFKSTIQSETELTATDTVTTATKTTPVKTRYSPATTPEPVPETPKSKTEPVSGLKRSGATRSASSPLKSGSAKKPFRELLRDAFRGESGVVYKPTTPIPSYETVRDRNRYLGTESEDSYEGTTDERKPRRRSSGASSKSGTLTAFTESAVDSGITESSDGSSSFVSSATPSSGLPKRRPPPTSGDHELSTIVSVESYSTQPSDTMSTISESTVTQDTILTKGSGDLSRQKSQKSSTGLKRRLTKHSDLVSVLSLPEDSQLPARTRSIRLARSLHRKTSKLDNANLDDLLLEFQEDENIYRRELKTLASGVIPVLLTQFVDEKGDGRAADVFRVDLSDHKADIMSRAVVNMGVILEKLSLLHQFVPVTDAPRMVDWLEKVYPFYDNYLDVWRLGFQGVIVNLAPAAGKSVEEDSMVNGMERNEEGDVLDENGERVDVAYLLRRPLVRIKWMLKFAKGVNIILGRGVAGDIVYKLENLLEKARRRNREEIARKVDEDASSTDTTRVRDLRTLAVLDNVNIDQTRQVSAKDWFDLSLSHSNGQRLDCQVELIFRDKISDATDHGDVLIRETGGGGQSWLLFPPIPRSQISACKGQDNLSLTVMIRDTYKGREWYELITVVAELDETAADWLDILGTSPIPPPASNRMSLTPRNTEEADVPVGERKFKGVLEDEAQVDSLRSPTTPTRYHKRRPSAPGHPARSGSSSHPLREDMRPDPSQLKTSASAPSIRDDGAPPPPAHREPVTKATPIIEPPVDLNPPAARVRRRTSSPLKHEYHPSDISSGSDSTSDSSGSESDSSSDELEEDDVPDTLPGISIKQPDLSAAESVVSESSITPSNSASQAGLPGLQASYPSESNLQLMASISYWSNRKGQWKDLGEPFSAIVISPGLIEAYVPGTHMTSTKHSPGFGSQATLELEAGAPRPLIALDLTPLVMIRQSTVVDLEIRSPVRSFAKYCHLDANIFRFRTQSPAELGNLYAAVHESRMNNAKFKALEEEARFRSFGQPQPTGDAGDDTSSHRRRSWFGRKNSYRASTRAPSQSQGSSSSVSATSFLRRLTGGGNTAFNINGSSVDRQSRAGSGGASFYTSSGSSSAGGGGFSFTAPRSPSVSLAESSSRGIQALGSSNIKMRCHLQTSANKWEDRGNCFLTIARPPPGVRQELTIYHGLEKRVLVVSIPKKANEKPLVVVDVVVGSACFSRLAARGIVLNVWEEIRDEQNRVGSVPSTGAVSGRVRKWCFQFSSAAVASWVFGLVASEVEIA